MELIVLAQHSKLSGNVLSHLLMVFWLLVYVPSASGQIIFYTMLHNTVFQIVRRHLQLVHEAVVNTHHFLIALYLLQRMNIQFIECSFFSQFLFVTISYLFIDIKPENILIWYRMSNRIFVQHAAKQRFRLNVIV